MQGLDVYRWVKLGLAALLLNLLLISPNHPEAVTWQALSMVAIELPLILLLLVALPTHSRFGGAVRTALVVILMVGFVLKGADFAMRMAFERHFNLITDWDLVWAGWATLLAAVGAPLALAGLVLLIGSLVLITWLLWHGLTLWLAVTPGPVAKTATYGAMVVLGVVGIVDYGQMTGRWQLENKLPIDTFASRNTARYVTDSLNTYTALQEFKLIATAQAADTGPGTLAKLKGHDVLILFVESYGRSSLQNPLYAQTQLATLKAAESQLKAQGLAMRSGWLDAPTLGGQSWLSHSTLATGMWISNQGRYRAMLGSPRNTLFHDARMAGFRTVAIMPALRMTWPDGEYFGFDRIYQSSDLGYRGEAFNWVLVPDQFALAALDRLERDQPQNNLFVQVALSSSHAPFTPVPELLSWDELGDGTVFNAMARSGDTPSVVWADADRVREQYRLAVNYSLQTVFDYVERHADRQADRLGTPADLVVVVGDHEPAPFISGNAGTNVPIHVIGPPALIDQINAWDWTPGLVPVAELPAWSMEIFRERFIEAFSQMDSPRLVTQ